MTGRAAEEAFGWRGSGPETIVGRHLGVADFARIVRRRKTLILWTVGTILLLTLLAVTQITPTYSASAVLMIEPTEGRPENTGTQVVLTPDEELRIATKIELLQSRALARDVARSIRLAEDPEFAPAGPSESGPLEKLFAWLAPKRDDGPSFAEQMSATDITEASEQAAMEAVTDKLIEHVKVERVGRSHLIRVTASSVDPHKAALIANRMVERHIKSGLEQELNSKRRNFEVLSARVEQLRSDVLEADSAVADYMRANDLTSVQPDNSAQRAHFESLLASARVSGAESRSRAASANGAEADAVASSPLLEKLRAEEATFASRLAELSSLYGPGYPEVAQVSAKLADVRAGIASEISRVGDALESEASISQTAENALLSEAAALNNRNARELGASTGLKELERYADTKHALFVSLLAQLQEVRDRVDTQKADARIISKAPVPERPSSPQPKRMFAVAFIGSLIAALIFALSAEALDNRLRTGEQIDRELGIPTLAMIPDIPRAKLAAPAHMLVRKEPLSIFSEAMRNLYIELVARQAQPGSQVVAVTSPLANEGKTTVATSLAAAANALGHSAVVVDLDLRRPGIVAQPFEPEPRADVVAFLSNQASMEEMMPERVDPARFATIRVHGPAADPGTLIMSPRLPELLNGLRDCFDLIVLNAPPILPVRDAKTLGGIADSTVLVLRWGKTKPDAARVALELFGDNVTGAVLNRVDYRKHAKRGYGDAIHYFSSYSEYYAGAAA